jgi:alcohol dehydrogenase (cytochrome c)
MTRRTAVFLTVVTASCAGLLAQGFQGLDPKIAQNPPTDAWPTYHGDYSGRHFSPLTHISTVNVKALSLAWVFRTTGSTQDAIVGRPPGAAAPDPAPVAGRGGGPPGGASTPGATIKAIPIVFDGRLYVTTPNHVYAVDARTGSMLWHYAWQGRNAIGNRGVGMWGKWLFVATPDNSIVGQPELHRIARSRHRRVAMEVVHHASTGRARHRDVAECGDVGA